MQYVHCLAGVGRTGVYCVVDCVLRLLEEDLSFDGNVDLIEKVLLKMRKQRPGLIQTLEQFEQCYEFVKYFVEEKNKLSK